MIKVELKEGMYCYEKNNRKAGIGKISAFEKYQNVVIVYKKVIRLVTIGNVEASYNILDIIKVGDYVNGYKVTYVYPNLIKVDSANIWEIHTQDIKSIVTKEQFESMKYVVERDD